jgi:hypothetical protein
MANNDLENDQYVKQWLAGLSAETKRNYLMQIRDWITFIGMTPTEQIKKRMHDLATEDLAERPFFRKQV